ncbi:MAG: HIT family protein, partial [Armatimonadetes bacterium]|nr:HIT family protein [Armatimonadota bacterium]
RAGTHPGLLAEMETGYAGLGDSQYFRGYSLLLCKTPATELHELPPDVRRAYLEEMALLAQAVYNVVQPHKLNYECLGNQVPHLHWHVFPRAADEPHPRQPVWTVMPPPEEADRYALDPQRHAPLIASLRAELMKLRGPE